MTKDFDLFAGGPNANLNACVGENGLPGIHHYVDGYFVAAKAVAHAVVKGQLSNEIDTVVYPILFSARHAIELSLKAILSEVQELIPYRPAARVESKILTGHDIGKLWEALSDRADQIDRRLVPPVTKLESLIRSYSKIDPNGQVFRYPHDLEKRYKHLKDHSIINIERFLVGLNFIEKEMKSLRHIVLDLPYEYSLGTYTKTLSRADIEDISVKLPDREDWSSNQFDSVKAEIQSEYEISNREFCQALNKIQEHYEFSANIGEEKVLAGVSADKIRLILDTLEKTGEPRVIDISKIDFSEDKDWSKRLSALVSVSDESLRMIYAVFDFGADRYRLGPGGTICERFGEFTESVVKKDRIEVIRELGSNLQLRRYLSTGLRDLGQVEILKECSLEDYRDS